MECYECDFWKIQSMLVWFILSLNFDWFFVFFFDEAAITGFVTRISFGICVVFWSFGFVTSWRAMFELEERRNVRSPPLFYSLCFCLCFTSAQRQTLLTRLSHEFMNVLTAINISIIETWLADSKFKAFKASCVIVLGCNHWSLVKQFGASSGS